MSNGNRPPTLKELARRLGAAREQREKARRPKGGRIGGDASGLAIGLRIAVEIVAAVGVGVGLGLALDRWLGTKPWLMLVFALLGTAAAFLNVVRTAKELDRKARAEKDARRRAEALGGDDEG